MKNEFTIGYLCACANMLREFDQPTMVASCLKGCPVTLKELHVIGLDEEDIKILSPIIELLTKKK